ncbi:MAG: hypothetical protein AVDCRST_MAG03-3784 [uncultured Rubrobacteraceae bacterium]|uniref:Uncharacterized protein n=1 Tax=uncultured Rubrobacteraceae bacterium TaxID=349277 RepID=A0A6J4QD18_9ACTN|nr:MAG: hypothetical protein AVDCRST_MAG03-3784 [uncultured Rubrobacteraceae bacterium]
MSALTPQDLRGRTLGCGAGPASSDAEATAAGHRTTSCNPPRGLSTNDIRYRRPKYSWPPSRTPQALRLARRRIT